MTPEDVLEFWLGAPATDAEAFGRKVRRWFQGSPELDTEIRQRFGAVVERARNGDLDGWADTARGRLALIVVLDQFTRNLHRGGPRAYENDARALALTEAGIARGHDAGLAFEEALFFYLPLGHAEDLDRQERHVALLEARAKQAPPELAAPWGGSVAFARGYRDQIARFGRFPHRNAILGRTCTQDEMAFLASASPSG